MSYRKIWESYNGPIPKEKDGRRYEIHHIDGDRTNNNINNLVALTIQQHYDIHKAQGDLAACLKIGAKMKMSPAELSAIATANNLQMVKNGTHPFVGGAVQKKSSNRRVADGSHNFLDGTISKAVQQQRLKDGTHNFLDSKAARTRNICRVKNGSHHLLGGKVQQKQLLDGSHSSCKEWTCPHCSIAGKGSTNAKRWHFHNCKENPNFTFDA